MLHRFSHVQLFATLWTRACQAPLSIGFSSKNTGVGCHAFLRVWGRTWIDAKETEFDKILMKAQWLAAAPPV